MSYKVHRLQLNLEEGQLMLEDFLNNLKGEIVSVIPNNAKTTLAQIYGISPKVDFVLIVEKLANK